jgi:hypothetical protein
MPEPQPSQQQAARVSRLTAYIVTNGTKVVGVYLILKEASRETTRDSVLLAGAFLALGAQAAEDIILRIVDRIFNGGNGSR